MRLSEFRITRFQYPGTGSSETARFKIEELNAASLELIADDGKSGLGFVTVAVPPVCPTTTRSFGCSRTKRGRPSSDSRPHRLSIGSIDLAAAISAPSASLSTRRSRWRSGILRPSRRGLPLHRFLGSRREPCPGLCLRPRLPPQRRRLRGILPARRRAGFEAFKIKVGHPDFDRDLSRLRLLTQGGSLQARS